MGFSPWSFININCNIILVAQLGFEPRLTASKAAVLPLDDRATNNLINNTVLCLQHITKFALLYQYFVVVA